MAPGPGLLARHAGQARPLLLGMLSLRAGQRDTCGARGACRPSHSVLFTFRVGCA